MAIIKARQATAPAKLVAFAKMIGGLVCRPTDAGSVLRAAAFINHWEVSSKTYHWITKFLGAQFM